MDKTLLIGFICLLLVFLLVRMPTALWRLIGNATVKLAIGLILLLCLNLIGNQVGLYLPINVFTVLITSMLGILGLASLVIIQLFIL